ncbi:MAG: ester cyclase [Candidatus Thorarchaeota archaeon SMTZ1-83]
MIDSDVAGRVPSTGKQVSVDGIIVYRPERQKIVEYWGVFDTLSLLRQLGVVHE